MLGLFLGMFSSPFNKIISIISIVIIGLGIFWGWMKLHDATVRREALENFNKQQLEIVIKEQQEFNRQTRVMQETQTRIVEALAKKIEDTEKKVSSVEEFLSSPEAKKEDREASKVLKETLKRLGAPK